MPANPDKLRLHIAALTSQPELFWVTEARFRAASRRNPEQARHLATGWSWDFDGLEAGLAKADIVIGWRFPDLDWTRGAPRLKWIQLTGAGSEHLQPFDWLPRGVVLTNNSGVHAAKAAEFAGTAILMLNNRVPAMATSQRNRRWEKNFSSAIDGKTVLMIGLGAIGGAVARWVKQRLGLQVIAVRRSGGPHRHADRVVTPRDLDKVLPKADFVVITTPLTAETEGLLDRRRLALLKSTAGLVNLGRARVVDYAALAEFLTEGRIAGAVLDVFDPEPLPKSSPLWTTPNLIISAHCSSDDEENYIARTLDLFFDNLKRMRNGQRLKNRISNRRQY